MPKPTFEVREHPHSKNHRLMVVTTGSGYVYACPSAADPQNLTPNIVPKLPDVIQKIVELREYRASMLRANPPKYPICKDCDSTGWIQVQEESRTHPGKMVMKSVRCVCRKNFVLTAE